MKIRIEHTTLYTYSKPVTHGVHYLHFYPQSRPFVSVTNFQVHVRPTPQTLSARLDAENNLYHQMWMDHVGDRLEIQVEMELELRAFNPFDFLIDEGGPQSHEAYLKANEVFLASYLMEENIDAGLSDYVQKYDDSNAIEFFGTLVGDISAQWEHRQRLDNNLMPPRECFDTRSGSCRDLSRMLMAMLRCRHYACRFVSGYSFVSEMEEGHELHAWVEVYLPGSGWLGLDPSLGLLTESHHIPVACSFDPIRTMPVQGFYSGSADSTLSTKVMIREIP